MNLEDFDNTEKLRAAAPDLLKALKLARNALIEAQFGYIHRQAIDEAFIAIKKAEGEQS
jgi:hypothetical protein